MSVRVEIVGIAEALATTERVENRLLNLEPLFRDIGALLESNANVRFDTKTDPDGKPWQEWAPSTRAAREREGRGTLMEYSGLMREGLSSAFGPSFAEVFLTASYADAHERPKPTSNLPRRSMLTSETGGLGAQDLDDVLTAIEKYLNV